MKRLLLIAAREYFAYTRTIGFWLSMLSLPLIIVVAGAAPILLQQSTPAPRLAIVDLTVSDRTAALTRALKSETPIGPTIDAAGRARPPSLKPIVIVEPPPPLRATRTVVAADAEARRLLQADSGPADAVVILSSGQFGTTARLWTRNAGDDMLAATVARGVEAVVRDERLIRLGIAPAAVESASEPPVTIEVLSPKSASGEKVELRDRLPGYVGLAAGFMLWSLVLTGAGLLMNSVIEEKSNRVLEVLLSSASSTEILGGKVLGVALVTLTVLAVWGTGGLAVLLASNPPWVGDLLAVLGSGMLLPQIAIYFIGGYLMYAVVFAAVGSFCETSREAQTLLGPVMVVLMAPLFVMQMAVVAPETPILKTLSWFPLFTPFLMPVRIPTAPPLIEVIGTVAGMVATAVVMVWLAGRAFRAGALSTGKIDLWRLIGAFRRQG